MILSWLQKVRTFSLTPSHVCNIDRRERLWRFAIGIVFLFDVAVWWLAIHLALGNARIFTPLFFVAAFLGAVGVCEAIAGFCVFKARLLMLSASSSEPTHDMRTRQILAEALLAAAIFTSFLVVFTQELI